MKKLAIAATVAFTTPLLLAGAASAGTGTVNATWDCYSVTVTSTKDISNLVYTVDGVDIKVEFGDGTHTYVLDGAATDVWIKAGNNKSGDGPGYGQHFSKPDYCGGGVA